MKRIYPFFAALLLILCGCGQKQTETSDTKETVSAQSANEASPESSMPESSRAEQNTNGISYQVKNAETPKAETASMEEPLSLGQWGTVAKYCTKDGSYCDIPVSILSVRRGNDVTKEAMALAKKSGAYLFEPEEYEEYALCEYEIDLSTFPVAEGGTLCDITAFITDENGEMLKLKNGSYWGTTAVCLDQQTYYYEGVVHSLLAYKIPKECSAYLITAGEYGETQTYFHGL